MKDGAARMPADVEIVEAIALGGHVPALVARLHSVEQQRQDLLRQQEAQDVERTTPRVDWRLVERQAQRLLKDWRALLTRHAPEARQVLRELLLEPLMFTPILEENQRGFRFEAPVGVGEKLAGIVGNLDGVPGQN